jgi:CDP-diacylglycerol---glycerol-3-phosphate 3-phosphatidyltransferase
MMMVNDQSRSLTSLRWRWLLVALLYALGLLLAYWVLLDEWRAGRPMQWLGLAAATMLIQLGVLWWALQHNHRPYDSNLLPFLGYSNSMTLARGLLTCLLAGFLFAPRPWGALAWMPMLLYTVERLIDYFDGYVARITRNETKLGAILDIEFDGLGILAAILLAIQYGQLPVWYLILGLARQLFVAGMWVRTRWKLPNHPLPPTDQGRIVAGFQTGFISVALWPILSPQSTQLASIFFAVPLVLSFGRDWLVVSGVIDANSAAYHRVRAQARKVLLEWVPLAARLVGGALALLILWRHLPDFNTWSTYLASISMPISLSGLTLLAVLWALAVVLVLVGCMGRTAALLLLLLAFLDLQATGLRWTDNGLLLACSIIVAHAGSGKFAVWQPEEHLVRVKLGAPTYDPDKPPAR